MSRRRIETRRTFYGKSAEPDPLAHLRPLAATGAILTEIRHAGTPIALPGGNFGKNQ
ncbi:hypothetical protein WJ542_22205 [Paraburkholderia sp. B3]|uniref:hypothetical protein n=1 Tax=Paraburkholderia sp. B3 TaxID=3134791 RepID=UPI003981E47B